YHRSGRCARTWCRPSAHPRTSSAWSGQQRTTVPCHPQVPRGGDCGGDAPRVAVVHISLVLISWLDFRYMFGIVVGVPRGTEAMKSPADLQEKIALLMAL